MRTVVVTDLTRFSNLDIVCTAGIDVKSGECVRPMPYLQSTRCAELNIQPGAILKGDLVINKDAPHPHIEDASYTKLEFQGPSTSEQFKEVLENSLSRSISEGFNLKFTAGQKHIPIGKKARCSIITIKVDPDEILIHEDQYRPGKIKLTFTDQNGNKFRYLAITDRGYFYYAMGHQNDGKLQTVQDFIARQQDIYLRIGLSREYRAPDGRNGYWLQVNGIYTFPKYQQEIRSY